MTLVATTGRSPNPATLSPCHPVTLASSDSRLLRLVVWTAVFAIPAVTALQPVTEYDTWWHLRTGQWILEHGTVPTIDPFSTYGEGKPWVAYSWLFGLLLYGLHQGLGLLGIEERALQLGGAAKVDSQIGSGTILTVELPYQTPDEMLNPATRETNSHPVG